MDVWLPVCFAVGGGCVFKVLVLLIVWLWVSGCLCSVWYWFLIAWFCWTVVLILLCCFLFACLCVLCVGNVCCILRGLVFCWACCSLVFCWVGDLWAVELCWFLVWLWVCILLLVICFRLISGFVGLFGGWIVYAGDSVFGDGCLLGWLIDGCLLGCWILLLLCLRLFVLIVCRLALFLVGCWVRCVVDSDWCFGRLGLWLV